MHPGGSDSALLTLRIEVERRERAERRLQALARAARAELDRQREETGVDEWDESDSRCYLYNAAEAILERDANAAYVDDAHAELQIDECLEQADAG
jgi:hypothetical protein